MPPHREFYDLAQRAVGVLQQALDLVTARYQAACAEAAAKAAVPRPKANLSATTKSPRLQVEPHRATEFGRLVNQIEQRAALYE